MLSEFELNQFALPISLEKSKFLNHEKNLFVLRCFSARGHN